MSGINPTNEGDKRYCRCDTAKIIFYKNHLLLLKSVKKIIFYYVPQPRKYIRFPVPISDQ